ncbi:MAG: UxaA family hydrolase [Oscillospiraceae bacterium]|nr:UxaA family hydrolase [Oscillospiraceae bacterium]
MLRKSMMINGNDTVAILLENAEKGDTIEALGEVITLLEDVEFAHKAAITDHGEMSPVIKYGEEIGYLPGGAPKGTWIHNHIMKCDRGRRP